MIPNNYTNHAISRSQQRCFPPIVDELLNRFGEEIYDGHGHIKTVLTKKCFRKISKVWGRKMAASLSKYSGVYKLESLDTGSVITIGRITKRVKNN